MLTSESNPTSQPCVMVIFGASGDLTKRLLMPALYNLACDGLLSDQFALLGTAMDELTTDAFRERMSEDIKKFHTRKDFDQAVWDELVSRFHYLPAGFGDADAFEKLKTEVARLDAQYQTGGNVLFYFATPPRFFGLISEQPRTRPASRTAPGWKRIIVEKPFGTDLPRRSKLNREILAHWHEDQIYRVDHYLGKETVQNLLAFRFSNGMFEPLWNKQLHRPHPVQRRRDGRRRGPRRLLRHVRRAARHDAEPHVPDARLPLHGAARARSRPTPSATRRPSCWRPCASTRPRRCCANAVRGQYGPGKKADGTPAPGYRQEQDVNPQSKTETFAALRLLHRQLALGRRADLPALGQGAVEARHRDRRAVQEGARGASSAARRSTSSAPTGSSSTSSRTRASRSRSRPRSPGRRMQLQTVNMRFDYGEAFEASRDTGYEVMIYTLHERRRDAVLAHRPGRGGLARSPSRCSTPGRRRRRPTSPTTRRGTLGPEGGLRPDRARRPPLVRGRQPRTCWSKVPLFKGGDPLFLEPGHHGAAAGAWSPPAR